MSQSVRRPKLGLGTGGVHFVVAVEGAEVGDDALPGRIMKARYTPLQTAVASVEEQHRDAVAVAGQPNGFGRGDVGCRDARLPGCLGAHGAGQRQQAYAPITATGLATR